MPVLLISTAARGRKTSVGAGSSSQKNTNDDKWANSAEKVFGFSVFVLLYLFLFTKGHPKQMSRQSFTRNIQSSNCKAKTNRQINFLSFKVCKEKYVE